MRLAQESPAIEDASSAAAAAAGAEAAADGESATAPEAGGEEAFLGGSKKGKKSKSSKKARQLHHGLVVQSCCRSARFHHFVLALLPPEWCRDYWLQALADMDSAFAALDVASQQQPPAELPEAPPETDADADDLVFSGELSAANSRTNFQRCDTVYIKVQLH
jgi:hypothetical protein